MGVEFDRTVISGEEGQDPAAGERTEPGRAPERSGLDRGQAIGRYLVLERVGKGGMGVVYAAYDPDLDRKVAVKLLHENTTKSEEAQARLLREARAIAKLTHRNIVTIHDVGSHEGRVFLAMEFLEGQTLKQWRQAESRDWREVVDVLAEAAEGLAAAHQAGVVHRDFKPDNVMVTRDGVGARRVVVMDFGLARAAFDDEPESSREHSDVSSDLTPKIAESVGSELSTDGDLTRTGSVVGTPAYMSPEQHLGRPAGPASDQFSFAITLFECVYGERPFTGDTRLAIGFAASRGRVAEPEKKNAAPAWLHRAILEALSPVAEERFESMEALGALLREKSRPSSSRGGAVVAGVALVVAAGSFAWWSANPEDPCAQTDARMDEIWSEQRRAEVLEAMRSTDLGYAEATAEKVGGQLDDYAAGWRASRRDTCESTLVRREQSESAMDLRMACLDRRASSLETLLGVLAKADAGVVRGAVEAVEALPALEICDDLDRLRDATPVPEEPARLAKVEAARAEIMRARVVIATGRYDEARGLLGDAERGLEGVGFAPVEAELAYAQGRLLRETNENAEAAKWTETAYLLARANDHHELARDAATEMIYLRGYRLARYEEGMWWSRLATAEADRFGRPSSAHARIESTTGILYGRQGDLETARAHYLAAKKTFEEGGDEGPHYESTFLNLSLVHKNLGELEAARSFADQAHERALERYGDQHPRVLNVSGNLASIAFSQGDYSTASKVAQRSIDIAESTPGVPVSTTALSVLARVALVGGDVDEAIAVGERALSLNVERYGAGHPMVATTHLALADAYEQRGDVKAALEATAIAVQIRSERLPENDPRRAYADVLLAYFQRAAGQTEEGTLTRAADALGRLEAGQGYPLLKAQAKLAVARMLRSSDPESAARYEQGARDGFRAYGPGATWLLARLEAGAPAPSE